MRNDPAYGEAGTVAREAHQDDEQSGVRAKRFTNNELLKPVGDAEAGEDAGADPDAGLADSLPAGVVKSVRHRTGLPTTSRSRRRQPARSLRHPASG